MFKKILTNIVKFARNAKNWEFFFYNTDKLPFKNFSENFKTLNLHIPSPLISAHTVKSLKTNSWRTRTLVMIKILWQLFWKSDFEVLLWNVHQLRSHSGDIEEEQKRMEGPVSHVTIRWSISWLYKLKIALFTLKHPIKLVHITHRKMIR